MNNHALINECAKNLSDILNLSIKHNPKLSKSLVIFDEENELAKILTESYKIALPTAKFVNFNSMDKEKIITLFDEYCENDLVVLIQSSNFRLNDFRIRIHLFDKKFKVIEHAHLYRNDESVWDVYINSLKYDKEWYHGLGHKLHSILSKSQNLIIKYGEKKLIINSTLEIPKLNIGHYSGMKNIGGAYPIGEVFTESKDLTKVNGFLTIYAFADQTFTLNFYEPFTIEIKNGLVIAWSPNTPSKFIELIDYIKIYEKPFIREIGFGINKAITRDKPLGDITAYERILGLHVSLGQKHTVYSKEGINKSKAKFHVDLYLEVDEVISNNELIFRDGEYILWFVIKI